MGTLRRDLPGGGYIIVDEDTGNVVNTVGANGQTQPVPASPAPAQVPTPSTPAPQRQPGGGPVISPEARDQFFGNLVQRAQQAFQVGFPENRGAASSALSGQSTIADIARQSAADHSSGAIFTGQPSTPEPLPTDQPVLDLLRSIQQSVSTPVQYPRAPTYTPDPANAELVEMARNRQQRMDPLIQRLIKDVEDQRTRHGNRSNIHQFGEWLSNVAASGDASQAGVILQGMRDRTADRNRDWSAEIVRLTEAGYGLEEAIARAQAGVTSATHGASERTMEARFGRDVNQAEAGRDAQLSGANVGVQLAQILQQSLAAQEQRQLEALAQMSNDPVLSVGASRQLGAESLPGNPRMGRTFGQSIARQQRLRDLATRVTGPYQRRSDLRNLGRDLRRIDPNVTDDEVNQIAQMLSSAPAQ